MTGSGSSWKATEAPVPGNAADGGAILTQLACPSAQACLAAGTYVEASHVVRGLLLSGTGSSWQAMAAPLAPNGTVAIACSSKSTCFGVSSYTDQPGSISPLIISGPS